MSNFRRAIQRKALPHIQIAKVAITFAFLLISCNKAPEEPTTGGINNTSQFGGYTATNEPAAFGDPALYTVETQEEGQEFTDPLASSPFLDSISNDPEARGYAVRIIWGRLDCDSTVVEPTDWTGALSINRGVEILARTIRFEDNDYILPRTSRRVIQWVSHTRPCNDGILALLYNPRRPDSVKIDSVCHDADSIYVTGGGDTVHVSYVRCDYDTIVYRSPFVMSFETTPLHVSFTGEQLEALDTILYVEGGLAVHFQSTRLDRFVCPRGYLAGEWGTDSVGQGIFRGVWMSRAGQASGFVNGHWGFTPDSVRMFWGKWISADGRFEGLLRGMWAPHPDCEASDRAFERAGGYFAGRIFDAQSMPIGHLRGRYRLGDSEHPRGGFAGKWKLDCRSEGDDRDGGGRSGGDDGPDFDGGGRY